MKNDHIVDLTINNRKSMDKMQTTDRKSEAGDGKRELLIAVEHGRERRTVLRWRNGEAAVIACNLHVTFT